MNSERKIGVSFLIISGISLIHMIANWPPIRIGSWSYDIFFLTVFMPPGILLTFLKMPKKITKIIIILGLLIVIEGMYNFIFIDIYRIGLFLRFPEKKIDFLLNIFAYLIIPITWIFCGVGILLLKNWARKIILIICVISFCLVGINFIKSSIIYFGIYLKNTSLMIEKAPISVDIDIEILLKRYLIPLTWLIIIFVVLRKNRNLFKQEVKQNV